MTDTYVPNTLFLTTQAGHVARVANAASGTPSNSDFTDISPTAGQIAGLGTVIKLIADPFDYRRLVLYGSQGGFVCDDGLVSSPVWRSVPFSAIRTQQIFDFTASAYGFTIDDIDPPI